MASSLEKLKLDDHNTIGLVILHVHHLCTTIIEKVDVCTNFAISIVLHTESVEAFHHGVQSFSLNALGKTFVQ